MTTVKGFIAQHPSFSTSEFADMLRTTSPDISRSTIFYMLNQLVESGEIIRTYRDIEGVDLNGQVHYSTAALLCLKNEIELFNRISGGPNQSSRSQIGCITLARTIANYDDRPDVTEEDFRKAMEFRRYGLGDYYWRSLR